MKSQFFKKVGGWMIIMTVLMAATFGSVFFTSSLDSSAAGKSDPSGCLSDAGKYKNISSVQNACNSCTRNPNQNNIAAAWISNQQSGKVAEVVLTETNTTRKELEDKNPERFARIYGMSYSCGKPETANTQIMAYHVWFGKAGKDGSDLSKSTSDAEMRSYMDKNAYKFIRINGSYFGDAGQSFGRGVAPGGKYRWSTHGEATIKIKIGDFLKTANKISSTIEKPLNEANGNEVEVSVYELPVSVNRCFRNNRPGRGYTVPNIGYAGNGCGGDDSVIRLKIETKPDDDSCTESTTYEEDKSCFCKNNPDDSKCNVEIKADISTTSKITIDEQGEKYHDIHKNELETPKNGTATIKMSTKEEEVKVKFEHHLNYSSSVDLGAVARANGVYEEQLTTGYGVIASEKGPNQSYAVSKETHDANEDSVKGFQIPITICQMDEDTDEDDHCGTQVYSTNLFPFAGRLGTSLEKGADGNYTDDTSRAFSSGGEVPPDWDIKKDAAGNPIVITEVTVKTKPGEKVKICQKIKGKPKEYIYEGTLYDQEVLKDGAYVRAEAKKTKVKKRDADGKVLTDSSGKEITEELDLIPQYFLITGVKNDASSGSAWSKACAVIYRPEEPDVPVSDTDNPGPESTSTANNTLMYAGEAAGLIWGGRAKNINTLRVKAAQSIVALVPVDKQWSGEEMIKGTFWYKANEGGEKRDVCTYFSDKEKLEIPAKYASAQSGGCKETDLEEWDTEAAETSASFRRQYGHAQTIAVPDNVGYKVCNSMGWKYEHWVGLVKKKESERGIPEKELPKKRVEWKKYEEDDYWTTYDAKCRTIAKKPSTAVWNGSLMTMGGVKTSLSARIDFTDSMFGEKYDDGTKKLYGSWTEYLGIVNGKYYGLGTGGSLWKSGLKGGSEVDKLCNMKNTLNGNTPLTVSNLQAGAANGFSNGLACNALGNALVSQDTVYLGRLKSFLLDQASKGRVKLITNGTISNNVDAISGGPLATMQQNVIYIPSGDLTITGNVTQINAWVVVPKGKIKTCDSWADKTTEAAVRSKNGTLYKTDNMKCQNQLVFNGPVYAGGGLELRRTYGSDALMPVDLPGVIPPSDSNGRNRSAEIFNLSADTYLWAFAQAQRYDSSFTDAYIRELAPRY